jgi:DNA-binding beta-propeller fold protein YncE
VTISFDGVYALVAETGNPRIRKMIITTASVTTLAGTTTGSFDNGIGTNSKFSSPRGVVISPDGVYALVGDTYNHLIRQIIIAITTLAGLAESFGSTNGIGTSSKFNYPYSVSISPDGGYALVAENSDRLEFPASQPSPPWSMAVIWTRC